MKAYYERDNITIHHGDNCDVMGAMPRESVDLVVTSPPYDDLRTYGGHSWDFYGVAWQLKRLIKPGGVIVWIVADATVDGSETGTSMEQALHFKRLGLNLHDTMIYQTSKPPMNDGRYQACWEYMFVMSSGKPCTFNPMMVECSDWHKQRRKTPHVKTWHRDADGSTYQKEWGATTQRVADSVWYIKSGFSAHDPIASGHPAVFPEALARDHVLSWSNPGDVVLDPFCGSGTTMKAAKETGRIGVGIEINESYCDIAAKRLAQGVLFGAAV